MPEQTENRNPEKDIPKLIADIRKAATKKDFNHAADIFIAYIEGTELATGMDTNARQCYIADLIRHHIGDNNTADGNFLMVMLNADVSLNNFTTVIGRKRLFKDKCENVPGFAYDEWMTRVEQNGLKNDDGTRYNETILLNRLINSIVSDLTIKLAVSGQQPLTTEQQFQNKFDEMLEILESAKISPKQTQEKSKGTAKKNGFQFYKWILKIEHFICIKYCLIAVFVLYVILCLLYICGVFNVDVAEMLNAPKENTMGIYFYGMWLLMNMYLPAHFSAKEVLNWLENRKIFSERVRVVKFLLSVPMMWIVAMPVSAILCMANSMLTKAEIPASSAFSTCAGLGLVISIIVYALNESGKRHK